MTMNKLRKINVYTDGYVAINRFWRHSELGSKPASEAN